VDNRQVYRERERKREVEEERFHHPFECTRMSSLSAARFFPRQQREARCDDDERCPAFSGIYFPRGACIDDRADDLVFSHTEIEFVGVNSTSASSRRVRAPDLYPLRRPSGLLALFLFLFETPFVYCSILCIHRIDGGPRQLTSIQLHRP